jgi:hypothetical protein
MSFKRGTPEAAVTRMRTNRPALRETVPWHFMRTLSAPEVKQAFASHTPLPKIAIALMTKSARGDSLRKT